MFCCEVGRPLLRSEHEARQMSVGSLFPPHFLSFAINQTFSSRHTRIEIASPWKVSVQELISAGTLPVLSRCAAWHTVIWSFFACHSAELQLHLLQLRTHRLCCSSDRGVNERVPGRLLSSLPSLLWIGTCILRSTLTTEHPGYTAAAQHTTSCHNIPYRRVILSQ